jgi:hypothetical protein
MLNKLFGSNARAKLLKQFLFNPEEKYYIRQLARDLSLQVNSIRRELENLEDLGLLSSKIEEEAKTEDEYCLNGIKDLKKAKKDGKTLNKISGTQDKKFYRINQAFPLLKDLQSLVMRSQVLYKDEFAKDLVKVCKPRLLILTGIFIGRPEIGVDVFIVGHLSKEKMLQSIRRLEKELDREVNFTVMEPAEFKYRREIADMFLYNILEGEKIVVIDELGVI